MSAEISSTTDLEEVLKATGFICPEFAKDKPMTETVKEEQSKSLSITENGDYDIVPDAGKTLSKVSVNVNVESGGGDLPPLNLYAWENNSQITNPKRFMTFTENPKKGDLVMSICTNPTGYAAAWAFMPKLNRNNQSLIISSDSPEGTKSTYHINAVWIGQVLDTREEGGTVTKIQIQMTDMTSINVTSMYGWLSRSSGNDVIFPR